MEIEFDFRKEPSGLFGKIYRPVARVILIHQDSIVPEIFYVDSGADITLIPRSVGEILNFTNPKPEEMFDIKGIGEKGVPLVLKKVIMQIGTLKIKTKIGWALVENVPLLLGRENLFKYFEIVFFKNKKTTFRQV